MMKMVIVALVVGAGSAATLGQTPTLPSGPKKSWPGPSTAQFIGLGSLPNVPASFQGSAALAVSGDGLVVVGQANSPEGGQAFRWSERDGMVGLGDLAGGEFNSAAFGVSFDGSVVVGRGRSAASAPNDEAFRWTERDGMVGLGDLVGGLTVSQAEAVSGDGSVVVGVASGPLGFEPFRWTPSTGMTGLGFVPGTGRSPAGATAISADGQVVYGYGFEGFGFNGWRWTATGGMVSIGDLAGGSQFAVPQACTPSGNTAVGASASAATGQAAEGARWVRGAGWSGLGTLPGGTGQSIMNGVAGLGWVMVGQANDASGDVAVMWTPSAGLRRVKDVLEELLADTSHDSTALRGWTLRSATGVSFDGRVIVGVGINPEGITEGWIATLPPYCYANCDASTAAPALSALDLSCFLQRFAAGDASANCDGSTEVPILNSGDFACFAAAISRGCP